MLRDVHSWTKGGKKLFQTYLDDDVDGVVTDMVALISLIIGALLDRFRLTIGQSMSMIVGAAHGGPKCPKT